MVQHTNFYETLQEARMRLQNTIVKYKDDFFYVLDVTNHKNDGKFRIYLDELGHGSIGQNRHSGLPYADDWHGEGGIGPKYDNYIENCPDAGLHRRFATSKHFNKFRPFPLGNINIKGTVVHSERSPTRNMHQGLMEEAIVMTRVDITPKISYPKPRRGSISYAMLASGGNVQGYNDARGSINVASPEFYDMLMGDYPSFDEVVEKLSDPSVLNAGCAFDREWCLMRGPLDMFILCYKSYGVGLFDPSTRGLKIADSHEYLIESLEEMNLFNTINIKEVTTLSYA